MERKIVPFNRRGTATLDPAFERALFLAETDAREVRSIIPQSEPDVPKYVY